MNGIRPTKLKSIRKEYIWGTEDWLLSCLHEGYGDTPLLIKKITANDALSVQVHPDDHYAKENEGSSGKTEMWYVLDAEPDAYLYYGLKHRISLNEFYKRIQNGTITEVCQKVTVKKGDVFYIPAGLVHAIGKGMTALEIQQSSNVTYRIFDYGREDANHLKRELHVEKAAEVAGFLPPLQGHRPMGFCRKEDGYEKTLLVKCPYFAVEHYKINHRMQGKIRDHFSVLYIIEGKAVLSVGCESLTFNTGDTVFMPEGMGDYEIQGTVELLMSGVT